MTKLQLDTLKNGLQVLRIPMNSLQSVTVMALVNTGSRYEPEAKQGIAHFFEHIVFKGTEKFPTAHDLSHTIDSIGADFNAFTGKEYTGYYVKSAAEHLDLALDVVSDMLLTPRLRQEDIDREKGVIIEEMNMYRDMPQAHIANEFEEIIFAGTGVGHDIIGTKETVSSVTSQDFVDFLSQWYGPSNIILVVAGNAQKVNSDQTLQTIEQYFNKKMVGERQKVWQNIKPHQSDNIFSDQKFLLIPRQTEQAHFILGWPSIKRGDDKRYALALLSTILGEGMSSRLFSEVREKRGLCYYVGSSMSQFHDGGMIGARAGVDPSRVEEAIKVTINEFTQVVDGKKPITAQELTKAKDYTIGKTVLSLEDSESLAQYLGIKKLLLGTTETPEQVLEQLKKVTLEEVQDLAKELLKPGELRFGLIGDFEDEEKFKSIINY
jgi:predicted Zn-dependent peptidase